MAGHPVQIFGDDFFQEDLIAITQDGKPFRRDLSNHAHRKTRARERVTPDNLWRQRKDLTKASNLVFEEVAQRFNELESQLRRQSTHVVVQLDVGSSSRQTGATLNDIGVQRALR